MASNTTVLAAAVSHDHRTNSRTSERLTDVQSRDTSPAARYYSSLPRSAPPLHPASSEAAANGCLRICVSGRVFELTREQVERYPDSILADPAKMEEYFQPALGMFFFDRNRQVFEYIMQFYQGSGHMEFPEEVPSHLLELELAFYKIGHRLENTHEPAATNPIPSISQRGREFFSEPSSSIAAKIWMFLDIFFILTSVLMFMLRTEAVVIAYEEKSETLQLIFHVITIFCAIFFTVDLGGRLLFSKNKFRFFMDIMPWLDIISIIPLYTEIFKDFIVDQGQLLNILKLFRMARVARCLKLIRRSKRLILIFQILVKCKEELSILLLVWVAGTTISGSIMYYVETNLDNKLKFYSILESCWWAITTIGTIGYGNIRPISAVGQILTTMIIFCSMIFMTVPMTIIIRRFSDSYEQFERKKASVKLFGAVNYGTFRSAGDKQLNNQLLDHKRKIPAPRGIAVPVKGIARPRSGTSVPILVTQSSSLGGRL